MDNALPMPPIEWIEANFPVYDSTNVDDRHKARRRYQLELDVMADSTSTQCEWFCACPSDASGMVAHPVLGYVPTCRGCADKLGLDLVDLHVALLGCNADGSESLARAMARRNVQMILDGADHDEVLAATRAKVAQIVAERNEVSK